MAVLELLHELAQNNVRIWLEDDQLRFKAPKGAFTPALRTKLKTEKEAVIVHLRKDLSVRTAEEAIPRTDRSKSLPLSYAQQRLWFIEQWEPGTATYNISFCYTLAGGLDALAFEAAFGDLIERHESLRTLFPSKDSKPYQHILDSLPTNMVQVDLEAADEATQEDQARRWVSAFATEPFSLADGPLFRLGLVRLAPQQHLLVFVLHHIIADGWSMDVLLREWGICYRARLEQQAPELPELAVQYPDFAVWQRGWLDDAEMARQLTFWEKQLAPPRSNSELPTDWVRPQKASHRGDLFFFSIDPGVFSVLRKYREAEGATPFMTFLCAFFVLLHRESGQENLLVGTPLAQRDRGELEGMIGFLVNTLVLRADLEGAPRFEDLHRQLQATTLNSFAHADVPFEKLVEEFQPDRDPSRNPLIQVMFSMHNSQREDLALPGLTLTPFEYQVHVAHFDLTFGLEIQGDSLEGFIEYSTDLFQVGTIRNMAARFQNLLAGIAANPSLPITDYDLVSDSERQHLLAQWTKKPTEAGESWLQKLEKQARLAPELIACYAGDESLNYRELHTISNRMACALLADGVGFGDRIAVFLPPSIESILAMLATVKTGAVFVPIDPLWPAIVIENVIQAATPVLILGESTTLPTSVRQISVMDLRDRAEQIDSNEVSTELSIDQICAHFYESDAFGKVRGVALSQANLFLDQDQSMTLNISRGLHLGIASGVATAGTNMLICTGLAIGAEVCLTPATPKTKPEDIHAWLKQRRIQTLMTSVSSARAFLNPVGDYLSTLDDLIIYSEGLTEAQPEEFAGIDGPERIHFLFGSLGSLGLLGSTTMIPASQDAESQILNKVSAPALLVTDDLDRFASRGVPGQVWVADLQSASGYLNQPSETAWHWVPDPLSRVPGARRFRLNACGRWLNDGAMAIESDSSRRVRFGEFFLELDDLALELEEHPDVIYAYVGYLPKAKAGSHLVAWVQPDFDVQLTDEMLIDFLEERMATVCIPGVWQIVDEMVLDATGEIDVAQLPSIDLVDTVTVGMDEPRTPQEWAMAMIWSEVLAIEQLKLSDHFFTLGGHSLLAVQILSRVSDVFDQQLPIRTLFEHPTLGSFAGQIKV